MSIVGVNLDKISVERVGAVTPSTKIKSNMALKDISKQSVSFGESEQDLAKVDFEFTVDYEPKVGSILIAGHILYMEASKEIDKIIKDWKKDKKLQPELGASFANVILTKCNVKALLMSQEVNLPPNVRLPRVSPGEEPKATKKKSKK